MLFNYQKLTYTIFTEGPYHVFAGRECSRALAVMNTTAEECNDKLDDLTEKQIQTLNDWEKKFDQKYPVVGKVEDYSNIFTVVTTNSKYVQF